MQVIHHLIDVWENLSEHDRIDKPDRAQGRELRLGERGNAMAPRRARSVAELNSILQVVTQEGLLLFVEQCLVTRARVVAVHTSMVVTGMVDRHIAQAVLRGDVEAGGRECKRGVRDEDRIYNTLVF